MLFHQNLVILGLVEMPYKCIKSCFHKGNLDRVSFAVEGSPVFPLSHLVMLVLVEMPYKCVNHVFIKAIWSHWEVNTLLFHQMREHKDGGALRAAKLRTKLKFCPDFLIDFERGGFKVLYKTSFDHNFSRPARIELKFCTVAKLEELNNFCLDQNESYPWKKVRFRDLRLYLARARARARARPSRAGGLKPLPRRGAGIFQMARALLFFALQM